jgi:hypothetical protein
MTKKMMIPIVPGLPRMTGRAVDAPPRTKTSAANP